MRNILKRNEQIFSKLAGFLDISISDHSAKITKIVLIYFEGGAGKTFFDPPVSPPILDSELKFFGPLEI